MAVFDPNLEVLQTNRYEDLTTAEIPSMIDGELQFLVEHDEDRARRIINASLDLEHFISVLPLDPTQVPQQTLDEIRKQRDDLSSLIGKPVLLHLFGERDTDKITSGGS